MPGQVTPGQTDRYRTPTQNVHHETDRHGADNNDSKDDGHGSGDYQDDVNPTVRWIPGNS
jgi:hypothetical protein